MLGLVARVLIVWLIHATAVLPAHSGHYDAVMLRRAALVSVIVLCVVALLVVVWPSNPDRTDKILKVYAAERGLTEAEARQQRDDALDVANHFCSIEPANFVALMARSTTTVAYAIEYARAACPDVAHEFEDVVEASGQDDVGETPIRADLSVKLDADLSTAEINNLGFAILRVPGVDDVQGDAKALAVQLQADADDEDIATAIRALAGVAAVERA